MAFLKVNDVRPLTQFYKPCRGYAKSYGRSYSAERNQFYRINMLSVLFTIEHYGEVTQLYPVASFSKFLGYARNSYCPGFAFSKHIMGMDHQDIHEPFSNKKCP